MSPAPYDLVVIGAGPAGASAAIVAAHSGARVLLLERGRLPRDRVCGEFVSAESLDLLRSLLNASDINLLEASIRIPEARFFSDGVLIHSALEPPAASIARQDLDIALWHSAKAAGVEAHQQVSVKDIAGEGPFSVRTDSATFHAKAVIDASGRWSNLSPERQASQPGEQKWLGVKAHFREDHSPNSVDLYFFEGGYCGVQPVILCGAHHPFGVLNVCAKVQAKVALTLEEVFALHPELLRRSLAWRQVTDTVSTSPLRFRNPEPLRGNILLAGDAAGFVDPFVGDGISLALRSGACATESLRPFFAGLTSLQAAADAYAVRYNREFLSVFHTSSKIRHVFFRLPRVVRAPLLSAVKRSPRLVHQLVKRTR